MCVADNISTKIPPLNTIHHDSLHDLKWSLIITLAFNYHNKQLLHWTVSKAKITKPVIITRIIHIFYAKPSSHVKVNEVNESFLFPLLSQCNSPDALPQEDERITHWDYSLLPSHSKDSFKMKESFTNDTSQLASWLTWTYHFTMNRRTQK